MLTPVFAFCLRVHRFCLHGYLSYAELTLAYPHQSFAHATLLQGAPSGLERSLCVLNCFFDVPSFGTLFLTTFNTLLTLY